MRAADPGDRLLIDQRQPELRSQGFVDHALLSASVDQCRDQLGWRKCLSWLNDYWRTTTSQGRISSGLKPNLYGNGGADSDKSVGRARDRRCGEPNFDDRQL
jgi:hypothetical protein